MKTEKATKRGAIELLRGQPLFLCFSGSSKSPVLIGEALFGFYCSHTRLLYLVKTQKYLIDCHI